MKKAFFFSFFFLGVVPQYCEGPRILFVWNLPSACHLVCCIFHATLDFTDFYQNSHSALKTEESLLILIQNYLISLLIFASPLCSFCCAISFFLRSGRPKVDGV